MKIQYTNQYSELYNKNAFDNLNLFVTGLPAFNG